MTEGRKRKRTYSLGLPSDVVELVHRVSKEYGVSMRGLAGTILFDVLSEPDKIDWERMKKFNPPRVEGNRLRWIRMEEFLADYVLRQEPGSLIPCDDLVAALQDLSNETGYSYSDRQVFRVIQHWTNKKRWTERRYCGEVACMRVCDRTRMTEGYGWEPT